MIDKISEILARKDSQHSQKTILIAMVIESRPMSRAEAAKFTGGNYIVNRRCYQRAFSRLSDLKLVACETVDQQKIYSVVGQSND